MDVFLDIAHTVDYELLHYLFVHFRGSTADSFWTIVTYLGSGGAVWIALALCLLPFRRTRRAGIAIAIALLISLLLGTYFLKYLFMRPRPFVTHPDLIALVAPGDQWSFPSGHTLSSFAAAAALFFFHKKSGAAAFILAALIGFSRLYACVHYPSDVLGGLIIGIICGVFSGWLTDRLSDRIRMLRLRKGSS